MKYGRNNFVPDLTHGLSKPVNPHKTSRRPHTTPAALFFSPAGERVMNNFSLPPYPSESGGSGARLRYVGCRHWLCRAASATAPARLTPSWSREPLPPAATLRRDGLDGGDCIFCGAQSGLFLLPMQTKNGVSGGHRFSSPHRSRRRVAISRLAVTANQQRTMLTEA